LLHGDNIIFSIIKTAIFRLKKRFSKSFVKGKHYTASQLSNLLYFVTETGAAVD